MSDLRDIMGVAVTAATTAEMIAELDARLAAGERIKLAFLNAHTSNLAAADPAFRAVLNGFTVLNDGAGVAIASRWLHGKNFPDNLNGTDFVPRYLAETARPARIFLLGGRPGVAEEAAAKIRALAPQHTVAGTRHGYFKPEDETGIVAEIASQNPDILLIALGNPIQELFINRHFAALGVPLAMGVGALFDFLSGRVSRAPAAFRRLRLEWVYRLGREPGRLWRRYLLGNSKFLWRLLRARRSGGPPR
jgi:exopolysaccharide biosynthesis WecB/TagA/CpsF family protein